MTKKIKKAVKKVVKKVPAKKPVKATRLQPELSIGTRINNMYAAIDDLNKKISLLQDECEHEDTVAVLAGLPRGNEELKYIGVCTECGRIGVTPSYQF